MAASLSRLLRIIQATISAGGILLRRIALGGEIRIVSAGISYNLPGQRSAIAWQR
jgi:hypothetical protein